jgi:hypothetical protein
MRRRRLVGHIAAGALIPQPIYAEEFVYRVQAGQQPGAAFVAANSLAAESLNLQNQIGAIAPGMQADIDSALHHEDHAAHCGDVSQGITLHGDGLSL